MVLMRGLTPRLRGLIGLGVQPTASAESRELSAERGTEPTERSSEYPSQRVPTQLSLWGMLALVGLMFCGFCSFLLYAAYFLVRYPMATYYNVHSPRWSAPLFDLAT